MNHKQKIIEEFEEKFIPLKPGFSVAKDWTKNLGGTTANYMTLKSFLLSSLHQIATEAIEAVKLERQIISGDFDAGYNSAIEDIEQNAKKFLEDNFSEKQD